MVQTLYARINPKLKRAIEQDCKQRGMSSLNEYFVRALEHFLTCSKLELSAQMRLIVLKYDGKCLRCGNEVKAGNWALYGRGVGVVCMDCYIERIGDKALVAKYLKIREWKQVSKALKAECERLAQDLEDYRLIARMKELETKNKEVNKSIMQYLTEKIGTPDEQQGWEEIVRKRQEEDRLVNGIRELYEKLKIRKKRPKSVYA